MRSALGWARRRERSPIEVPRGERVLAWTTAVDGVVLAGTREACYLGPSGSRPVRIGWEQVEAADWDSETDLFRISEVGTWGEIRPEHTFTVTEPGTFLELVRERVTASVVLVRHVRVRRTKGLRVVGRRAPAGGPISWVYEFDEGIDETDPAVRRLAAEALAAARDEVGDTG